MEFLTIPDGFRVGRVILATDPGVAEGRVQRLVRRAGRRRMLRRRRGWSTEQRHAGHHVQERVQLTQRQRVVKGLQWSDRWYSAEAFYRFNEQNGKRKKRRRAKVKVSSNIFCALFCPPFSSASPHSIVDHTDFCYFLLYIYYHRMSKEIYYFWISRTYLISGITHF